MKINDECFFYHTGKVKSIVGVVKITKEAFFRVLAKNDLTMGIFPGIANSAP